MFEEQHIGEGTLTIDGVTLHHSGFNEDWLRDINPEIIVDVGAYDFGDSIRLKQRYHAARVFAFELNKDNFDKFSPFAIKKNVDCYNVAISDKDGLTDCFLSKHFEGVNAQSSIYEPTDVYKNNYPYVSHSKSSCHAMRLDSFEFKKIDFLHIDVEGAENAVLKGLGNIRPTLIYLEYLLGDGWHGQSFDEVNTWFSSNGYTCVKDLTYDKLFYKIPV